MRYILCLLSMVGTAHGFQSVPLSRTATIPINTVETKWTCHPSFNVNNNRSRLISLPLASDDESSSPKEEEEETKSSDEVSEENSSSDESKKDDDDDTIELSLTEQYQVASAAYSTTVAYMILRHGIFNVDIWYSATGPFMGAALTYILTGASTNNRLGSDTYKRLNTFLLEYASLCFTVFGCLCLRALVTFRFPTFAYVFFGIANGLALVPSFKGWKQGAGVDESKSRTDQALSLLDEVKTGNANAFKGLRKFDNYNSLVYLIGTWLFGLIKSVKLLEVMTMLMRRRAGTVAIGARVARFAKLSILVAIMYTLKDAADRKRLEGTTFVQLNFVASAVFASMSLYWYEGLMNIAIYLSSFFSVFTGVNGAVSAWKKRTKAKEAEEAA